jgi:hypothetical protein
MGGFAYRTWARAGRGGRAEPRQGLEPLEVRTMHDERRDEKRDEQHEQQRDEQRDDFRTVAPGTAVFYRRERAAVAEGMLGPVEDLCPGGLFIGASHPPPVGTVLELQIYGPTDPETSCAVHARALVVWRRRWGELRGMGVRFLDFAGQREGGLAAWMETVVGGAPARAAPSQAASVAA